MLVQVLLTGVAGVVLHKPVGPLVPALDSYWFGVHIGAVDRLRPVHRRLRRLAHVPAAQRLRRGQARRPLPFGRSFANAETVERLSFRMHAFAFPIWTFGVAAGAIWAEAAWGRYWGWDPKETWAFISWIVYAGYLHARATPSIKRSHGRLDRGDRLPDDADEPVRRQHLLHRPALLRRRVTARDKRRAPS